MARLMLDGVRTCRHAFTFLHQTCEVVYSKLQGDLRPYNMIPGKALGKAITVAMEAIVRVQV